MRVSTTKLAAFASFSRLVFAKAIFAIAIFATAIFFGMAIAQPAAAQVLTFAQRQPSPHPARTASFAWLNSAISITPLSSPANHVDTFPGESAVRFTDNLSSRNFATLFPYQETKTSFVTEFRLPVAEFHLPLAQLGASSLRVGFLMQTLHNNNVAFGPLAAGQALHSFSQLRSVSLYGVGVSIPLGRQSSDEISQSLPWAAIRNFLHDR
jgi:hypothetical protein